MSTTLPSFAQVTQVAGDSTTNTLVNGNLTDTCTSGLCQVTGGTQVGNSLFHSFEQFSVGSGDEVNFVGTGVGSIFTRVTGASSFIDGTISTTTGGVTDLFLLNPQGILFGENATLDIDGSFIVTTADGIEFNNGAVFGVNSATPDLLSISTPVGLQYGTSPGAIEVQGPGHQMSTNPFTGEFDRTNRPSGLAVDSGQS
ncbi:MAG: filamentous hemagglutinin N-terminal domain-containing protein, partial [Cyanobacteria bacterium P01_D01_bin.56]